MSRPLRQVVRQLLAHVMCMSSRRLAPSERPNRERRVKCARRLRSNPRRCCGRVSCAKDWGYLFDMMGSENPCSASPRPIARPCGSTRGRSGAGQRSPPRAGRRRTTCIVGVRRSTLSSDRVPSLLWLWWPPTTRARTGPRERRGRWVAACLRHK